MTDKVQKIKQEIERRINISIAQEYTYSAAQLKRIIDFINSLPEEPASDDLEEAMRHYLLYEHNSAINIVFHLSSLKAEMQYHEDIENAFKAGAEWYKQQMKETLQTEYEKGRFDMREEMMKDAIETTIVNDWQYGKDPDHAIIPAIHQRIKNFNVCDRLKIIIVKED